MRPTAWLLAAAFTCAACDSSSDPAAGSPTAPDAFVNRLSTVVVATARINGCGLPLVPWSFDLVISASRSIFVDQVALHSTGGRNPGGSMATFPRADLNTMFGTTFVVGGGSRVFTFTPGFGCTWFAPGSLQARVLTVDDRGISTWTSTIAPH